MRSILGITAEYDPFHNGHAYQIRQARDLCAPEAVVCAMSGNFTQRGEPAILDKWERAALAVRCGVDLVFNLGNILWFPFDSKFGFRYARNHWNNIGQMNIKNLEENHFEVLFSTSL